MKALILFFLFSTPSWALDCTQIAEPQNEVQLNQTLKFIFNQLSSLADEDRHITTQKMNSCMASPRSRVLIMAFEGTGAYEPLVSATMSSFSKCFGGKLSTNLNNKVYESTVDIYRDYFRKSPKWSGLQRGVQQKLLSLKKSDAVDWYSFPSEEYEQLSGIEEIKKFSFKELYKNFRDSKKGNPKGIKNAKLCMSRYIESARKLKLSPKIVFISHSSGARSVIKLAEHFKETTINLIFTIDAIKEAHKAFMEVFPQKLTQPMRYASWVLRGRKGEAPYSEVHSQVQRKLLYKVINATEHRNYYQTDDRLGLKIDGDKFKFAIKGSPVLGALNLKIDNLSTSGHGEIAYSNDVIKEFYRKIEWLLRNE